MNAWQIFLKICQAFLQLPGYGTLIHAARCDRIPGAALYECRPIEGSIAQKKGHSELQVGMSLVGNSAVTPTGDVDKSPDRR